MKRLFAALKFEPSESFLDSLNSLQHRLAEERITWVIPSVLHLTIKFFGDTPESRIHTISECMFKEAHEFNPVSSYTYQLGVFGAVYKPKVIWVGFLPYAELTMLGEHFIQAFDRIGFPADRQNFVPHLTLARVRRVEHRVDFQHVIDEFRDSFVQEVLFNNIILYESILSRTGPTYNEISQAFFTA